MWQPPFVCHSLTYIIKIRVVAFKILLIYDNIPMEISSVVYTIYYKHCSVKILIKTWLLLHRGFTIYYLINRITITVGLRSRAFLIHIFLNGISAGLSDWPLSRVGNPLFYVFYSMFLCRKFRSLGLPATCYIPQVLKKENFRGAS